MILSLLMPTAAFAGRKGHSRDRDYAHGRNHRAPVEQGYITVRNDNDAALEVLVRGKVQGEVDAMSTARFGPFPEGNHKVRVRFNRRGLRFPVTVQKVYVGHGPARVFAAQADVGLLKVRNDWVEPMTVVLNGRSVGTIGANQKQLFKLRDAYGRVELRTPRGTTALTKHVSLQGLQRDRVAIVPPREGTVTITNPSRQHALDILCARGSVVATLPPSARRTVIQPAGDVTLTAAYRGQAIQRTTVLSSPYDRSAWTVALPTRSTLGVRNPNRFSVDVFVGGQFFATVAGNDKLMLDNVPVGHIQVELVGQGRRGGISQVVSTRVDALSGGFLPIPQVRVADGRGGSSSSCDSGYAEVPPRDTSRRGRGRSRSYARN
ncbi:MAG: hypothetical protein KDA24_01835 [Deltaproteobacteria bacterium]|nr:hypothetical protein [Deltaproteobacteria bacterium]